MKTTFTIVGLLILSLNSIAQNATENDFKVSWGTEYEFPKKHEDKGFWKGPKGGYINISFQDGKSMIVQRFDSKFKAIGEETIDLSGFPSNFSDEGIGNVGEKFYWFYSLWDKSREKEQLFVQELDGNTGKLIGTAKKLIETNKLTGDYASKGLYNVQIVNKFKISQSDDNETLLITFQYPKLEKDDSKNYDRWGWMVYNSSLEKIWGKELVKMPYTEEIMGGSRYMVSSKGTVYMVATVREPNWKELKKEKKGYNHFEILRLDDKSEGFAKIILNVGTRYAGDVELSEDRDGNLLLSGFYSNNVKSSGSNGVFLLKVEQGSLSAKEVKRGYYEFPKELLQQFESEKTKKKMDEKEEDAKEDNEGGAAEASYLTMQDIQVQDDGGIILSAEEYYVVTSQTRDSQGRISTHYTYHYNDILTMKINSDGEMEWIHKIPKRQQGARGRGGLSFAMYTMNGSHYYFYLDNIKNLGLSAEQVPAVHQDGAGGYLVYSKIDPAGKLTKGVIMDLRQEKIRIFGSEFKLVDNNQIVTRGKVDKEISKILSLTLESSKK
jgi:hypothetical protein